MASETTSVMQVMTPNEIKIAHQAVSFARANKKAIGKRRTEKSIYPPEEAPVSVFMAGSPGAGKTEASIALVNLFADTKISAQTCPFSRISQHFAWLQRCLRKSHRAERTVSDREQSRESFQPRSKRRLGKAKSLSLSILETRFGVRLDQSLKLYVYQNPALAWGFVKAREEAEGRRIRKEHFVDQYFAARDVVNALKLEYGGDIHVDLLLKHIDNSGRLYKAGVDKIDYHIPERHTRADLEAMLGLPSGEHS